MALIKYPYTNLHELNLDWIIEQLNNPDGPVRSVNGKSGIVTLTGEDIARSTSNPETVAAALQSQGSALQTVRNQIGVIPLPTTAQTLTGAIAENAQTIADVEDNVIGSTPLPTTAQTLTGAIAENAGEIANLQDDIGSTPLPTTAQTITGAVAEVDSDITSINNKVGSTPLPTTAQTLTGAIAEHESDITSLGGNLINNLILKVMPNIDITDSTFGFIDSGVSSADYIMLAAYTLIAANNYVRISNVYSSGSYNFRFQVVSATTEAIQKSGTVSIYCVYVARNKLGSP